MIGRAHLVLAALSSSVVSSTSASAECAWVLWQRTVEVEPGGDGDQCRTLYPRACRSQSVIKWRRGGTTETVKNLRFIRV